MKMIETMTYDGRPLLFSKNRIVAVIPDKASSERTEVHLAIGGDESETWIIGESFQTFVAKLEAEGD